MPAIARRVLVVAVAVLIACAVSVPADAACTAAPTAPKSLAASISGSTLRLTWVGDTSANRGATAYQILAGTTAGGSNVANFENGSSATQYSITVADGTYYVRVQGRNACGTSGNSNEVRVVVTTGTPAGVPNPHVLGSSVNLTEDFTGNTLLLGEVRNGWGGGVATFVEILASFFGSSGEAAGSESTYAYGRARRLTASRIITDTTLAPSQIGCFIMFTNIARARVATAQVRAQSDTYTSEALKGRVQLEGPLVRSRDFAGDLELNGQMRNTGDRLTWFNIINFSVAGGNGQSLDCDFTFVDGVQVTLPDGLTTDTGLARGGIGPFQTFTIAPFDPAPRVRNWIAWEENEVAGVRAGITGERTLVEAYRAAHAQMVELLSLAPRVSTARGRAQSREQVNRLARSIEGQASAR